MRKIVIAVTVALSTLTTASIAENLNVDCSASIIDNKYFRKVHVTAVPSLELIQKNYITPPSSVMMIPIIAKFNENGINISGLLGDDEWSVSGNIMVEVNNSKFTQILFSTWGKNITDPKVDVDNVNCYLIK